MNPPRSARSRWRRFGVPLAGVAILFMLLRWFESTQVYHPTRKLEMPASALRRPCEEVWLATTDGEKLHAWFFPANTNSPRRQLAVLVCHGNGGNLSHRLPLCAALLETGVAVFAFDYRGYGQSTGKPGEEGTYRDAQAAHGWLRQRGFDGTNIVAFGESLGGAVATELAVRETVGGLVLQSTFTSIPDVGAELFPWLPVRLIGRIKYDTHAKLPGLRVPVLVLHSRADTLVPFRHAERNLVAAHEPKHLAELSGDHNDSLSDPRRLQAGIEWMLGTLAR